MIHHDSDLFYDIYNTLNQHNLKQKSKICIIYINSLMLFEYEHYFITYVIKFLHTPSIHIC